MTIPDWLLALVVSGIFATVAWILKTSIDTLIKQVTKAIESINTLNITMTATNVTLEATKDNVEKLENKVEGLDVRVANVEKEHFARTQPSKKPHDTCS